jgi:hypothetical protein
MQANQRPREALDRIPPFRLGEGDRVFFPNRPAQEKQPEIGQRNSDSDIWNAKPRCACHAPIMPASVHSIGGKKNATQKTSQSIRHCSTRT